ncbi:MAG TPA: cyclic pyranopterin monophosphate synthase MoaC [Chloroflexota bacterium]
MNSEQPERLSHVDEHGEAHMVDVTEKSVSVREAEARGTVFMQSSTLDTVQTNTAQKGDVLAAARLAGIMAAKRTSELIPLCHALPLSGVDVLFETSETPPAVHVVARARTEAKTGVEMEALAAVSVAALTIYDMLKAVDRGMVIGNLRLTYKSGGRSGVYQAP